MSNCKCTNIFYIDGTFDTCLETLIDFGLTATIEGEHTLKTYFLGTEVTIKKTFEVDEPLKFPSKGLNENFEYVANILDPEGNEIILSDIGKEYNCFHFKTSFKVAL